MKCVLLAEPGSRTRTTHHYNTQEGSFLIWTSLGKSPNSWCSPPPHSSGPDPSCKLLFHWRQTSPCWLVQPEELMLFKGTVGLSAWSVATNLFTGVFWSETSLEDPNETALLKLLEGWKVAWGQTWPGRAMLRLCHNDISDKISWSQSRPSCLWLCALLFLLPLCFCCSSPFQTYAAVPSSSEEQPVVGSFHHAPWPHLFPLHRQVKPACIRILIFNI